MQQPIVCYTGRSLFVILIGAALSVAGVCQAQTTQKKTKEADTTKAAAKVISADGPLQAHNGTFDSSKGQVILRPKKLPGDTKPAEKFDFGLWVTIAQAWNQNKAKQLPIIKKYIESTVGLYDVSVSLGDAKLDPKAVGYPVFNKDNGTLFTPILIYVDPKQQSLTVVFYVTGNSMSAAVPVDWWFDDTMNAKFDLKLTMVFDTKGPASNPLVLKSSTVSVRNLDSSSAGGSELNTAFKKFQKASFTDAGSGKAVTASINTLLRQHTVSQKLGVVTPGMYAGSERLVFELSAAAPVLSPDAKNLKK